MADGLEQRRRALEEQFFTHYNEELKKKFKEKLAREESVKKIKEITGLKDDELVERLVDLGINAESILALHMVPLIFVAWADWKMQLEEKEEILAAARSVGIEEGSESYELLQNWLNHKPSYELFVAWKKYIQELRQVLSQQDYETLLGGVVKTAQKVAKAAGGFFDVWGTVSKEEKSVLKEIADVLQLDSTKPNP